MKIKAAEPATTTPGGKVKSVNKASAEFKIDFGCQPAFSLGLRLDRNGTDLIF